MDLSDFTRFLRSGWPIIVIGAVIGLVAGAAYTFASTPEYQSTSRVLVGTPSTSSLDQLSTGITVNEQIVSTYTTIATDPIVLDPVIRQLQLRTTAAELARHITATVPDGTLVIDIAVTDSSAVGSARIANAVSSSLSAAVKQVTPGSTSRNAPVRITVTSQASPPTSPISPNGPVDLVLGLMVGVILGLAAAFVRYATDTRLRSGTDASRIAGAPVVGGIAMSPRSERSSLIDVREARTTRGEEYRVLRTSLQFLDASSSGTHSFVFTSPVAGEGKTTTVANLAVAIAGTDRPVVLVDGDLRRPRLAELFGMDGSVGLADVLIGAVSLDEALQQWQGSALRVLPAGTIPPNPSELLQSRAMEDLLAELRNRFDVVLLDSPPVVPVADAAILASRTSGAIMVLAEGRSRRPALERAALRLEQTSARMLGIVMNQERRAARDGYGYGYGHSDAVERTSRAARAGSSASAPSAGDAPVHGAG